MIISFLFLTPCVYSSLEVQKIKGYDYKSKTKYMHATAMKEIDNIYMRKIYHINTFLDKNILKAFHSYIKLLKSSDESDSANSKSMKTLQNHYNKIFKMAMSDFFNTSFNVKNNSFAFDQVTFIEHVGNIIYKNICYSTFNVFRKHANVRDTNKKNIQKLLSITQTCNCWIKDIFGVCSNVFFEKLAENLGLSIFDFFNYFEIISSIGKDKKELELCPWDLVSLDLLPDPTKFFETIREKILTIPKNSTIIICFAIYSQHLGPQFLLNVIDSMAKEKNGMVELSKFSLYCEIDEVVCTKMDEFFFKCYKYFQNLYSVTANSIEDYKILSFNFNYHHNFKINFSKSIEDLKKRKYITFKYISDQVFQIYFQSLTKYVETIWSCVLNVVISKSGMIEYALMKQKEWDASTLCDKKFIFYIYSKQKMIDKTNQERQSLLLYAQYVFQKQKKMIDMFKIIEGYNSGKHSKKDLLSENTKFDDFKKLFIENIRDEGAMIELKICRIIFIFMMVCNEESEKNELTNYEIDSIYYKLQECYKILKHFYCLLCELSTKEIFHVQRTNKQKEMLIFRIIPRLTVSKSCMNLPMLANLLKRKPNIEFQIIHDDIYKIFSKTNDNLDEKEARNSLMNFDTNKIQIQPEFTVNSCIESHDYMPKKVLENVDENPEKCVMDVENVQLRRKITSEISTVNKKENLETTFCQCNTKTEDKFLSSMNENINIKNSYFTLKRKKIYKKIKTFKNQIFQNKSSLNEKKFNLACEEMEIYQKLHN
ncbi:hypothetical protein EDEG_00526 [Edhazardia aedis USNM 41457]|uniref:Uncharacterized protein n=1 Tax=Edhazardia aedis (strain USNM 41457) TaxID=1003232 RepID=J9D085_EDHAE|nr:hypothetical protein EDEG_00526 [Edhazardia aedis USNM 41457]|eukprot:EJW01281.1 hypothetical protein EDEG_00526 [Edhazardia aedis USNM 41457]